MDFVKYDHAGLDGQEYKAFGFEEYFKGLASKREPENTDLANLQQQYLLRTARYFYLSAQDAYAVEHSVSYKRGYSPYYSRDPLITEDKNTSRVTLFRRNVPPCDIYAYNGCLSHIHEFHGGRVYGFGFSATLYNRDPEKEVPYYRGVLIKIEPKEVLYVENPGRALLASKFSSKGGDAIFTTIADEDEGTLVNVFHVYERKGDDFREHRFVEHSRLTFKYDELSWKPYVRRDFDCLFRHSPEGF